MADTKLFCPWMLEQDRVDFKRPFAAIVGGYLSEAPDIWQTDDGTGTVTVLRLKHGLRISMLVKPATTRIHLSHRRGGVWFDMDLDTNSRIDFIGWLSMVKTALGEPPPDDQCGLIDTLDAAQVRMMGRARLKYLAD